MVMTSIMLSMFEAVVATTGEGFASHNIACAKMIDKALEQASTNSAKSRGANPGASGPSPMIVNVFFHVRIQLCFVYLTTSDDRIRNDPIMDRVLLEACGWEKRRLPLNMQIIAPFAKLMKLQSHTGNGLLTMSPTELEHKRAEFIKATEEVDELWYDYVSQNKGQQLSWTSPGTGHTDFRDPFTSLTYAYFSACYILIDLLAPTYAVPATGAATTLPILPSVPSQRSNSTSSASSIASSTVPPQRTAESITPSTSPISIAKGSSSPPYYDSSFPPPCTTDHYALILSVSWYLRLRDTGFAYLRLHAPLFLVAMYAPTLEQRSLARMVFEDWKVGSLRGIGWLAIAKLDSSGKVGRSLVG